MSKETIIKNHIKVVKEAQELLKLPEEERVKLGIKRNYDYINNTPELLSLLYDLDLLSEQLEENSKDWVRMMILTDWHREVYKYYNPKNIERSEIVDYGG